jgi:geranylgeranyl pyrophosphate synthase
MTAFLLDPFLDRERERVERALAAAVDVGVAGGAAEDVADAVRYAVGAGGKRLRPILAVAAFRAFHDHVPDALYRLAASLELIHTYSLVHDDLPSMDDDDVRRGRPSTHIAHGVATATVAGAALIPAAARLASAAGAELGLADARRAELVRTLCRAAGGGGMVGGQLLDLRAEGRAVTLPALERIHAMKTGALLRAAPVLGGMAAGADAVALDALAVYGAGLGLAFQVTDDILDVTGSSHRLGKTAGRDTQLEKATYPALAGLDEARRRAEREVEVALAALDAAGLESEELRALGRYAVERDR